jgi:hypothetical protein
VIAGDVVVNVDIVVVAAVVVVVDSDVPFAVPF